LKLNVSEYIGYFRGIWSKLGINQRISLVFIVLLILGASAGLLAWAYRPSYDLLYSRLDQADAGLIIEQLRDMNIKYMLRDGGRSIYVPTNKVYDLRLDFASEGIPKGKGVGFEIFDKTSFGITDFVQRMNYIRAIQGEISRTISQLEEVVSTRVHIVIPETELFSDNQKETTASIALSVKPGAVLSREQINGIRYLTASAVEGLDPQNITIIDQYGNILSKNSGAADELNLSANQLDLQKNVERHLATKAQSMLEAVLGINGAIVRVNADLNFEQIEVTEEKFDPESAVVRSEQITSEKSSGGISGGAPSGTASNLEQGKYDPVGGSSSQSQKEIIKSTYEIDRKVQKIIQSVGDIKKLSAAVFIRKLKDSNGNYVVRDANEMKQLEQIIQSALGYNEKRGDQVVVTEIVFNEEAMSSGEKRMQEAQRWEFIVSVIKNTSVVILIVVVLIIFSNLIKKARIDEGSTAMQISGRPEKKELEIEDLQEMHLPGVDVELRQKANLYQKAISKVANENPDNIVSILKGWLSEK
jgi:flagellar M-ring protein FliF